MLTAGPEPVIFERGELRAQAREASATLEDIFLKLTGGTEYEEVIRLLEEEAAP